MMNSKELKTKIAHAHSLILSRLTLTQSYTHINSLSLVLVAVMNSKEFKTKISYAHSLILSTEIGGSP